MSLKRRQLKADLLAILQETQEPGDVSRKMMPVSPTQPDIEYVAFAEAPAVTLHVRAKIQLRYIGANATGRDLPRVHSKLNLLGDNGLFTTWFTGEEACHGTEM